MMAIDDLKNLKYIEVLIDDKAKDGCWTNLRESREYAEEKLRSVGATLYNGQEKIYGEHYILSLQVRSHRNKKLPICYGSIEIQLMTVSMINGFSHSSLPPVGYNNVFMGLDNANNVMIQAIQDLFNWSISDN
ncbi:MAG: hypothetical protein P8L41_09720 [Paracoccaceae bacterium]|nr:hypothetical protein [Paracoccaceae bacterium]